MNGTGLIGVLALVAALLAGFPAGAQPVPDSGSTQTATTAREATERPGPVDPFAAYDCRRAEIGRPLAASDDPALAAFLHARLCGAAATLGFDQLWLPKGSRADVRLRAAEETSFRVYWVAAEAEELLEGLRHESGAQSRDAVTAAEELFTPTGILSQDYDASNGEHRLTIRAPAPEADFSRHALMVIASSGEGLPLIALPEIRIVAWVFPIVVAVALVAVALLLLRYDGRGVFKLLAGPSGRLSLTNSQIAFFTLIVFAVSAWLLVHTGSLPAYSETILYLIGIVVVSSASAKTADTLRHRLGWESWAWLKSNRWTRDDVTPRFADLVEDPQGNFDIFRFQAVIFSLLVGIYIAVEAIMEGTLAAFDLDESVLAVLGLSQAAYVTGKAAVTPKWDEFDKQVATFRDSFSALRPHATNATRSFADLDADVQRLATGFEGVFGHPPLGYILDLDCTGAEDKLPLDVAVNGHAYGTIPKGSGTRRFLLLQPGPDGFEIRLHALPGSAAAGKVATLLRPERAFEAETKDGAALGDGAPADRVARFRARAALDGLTWS